MPLDIPPDSVSVTVTFTRQVLVGDEVMNITKSLTYTMDEYMKMSAEEIEATKADKVARYLPLLEAELTAEITVNA